MRRGSLTALAVVGAAGFAAAGPAVGQQIDPSGLTPLPCPADAWCGTWTTDAPTSTADGTVRRLDPLGTMVLDRVEQSAWRAFDGRDFGQFPLDGDACSETGAAGRYYAGRYDGGAVLACADGSGTLAGFWRSDTFLTGGGPVRSGSFRLTTTANPPRPFFGSILQHNLASNGWSGRCASGGCAAATGTAPSPSPSPSPSPAAPQPPAPTARQPFLKPGVRDSTESVVFVAGFGSIVSCGFALGLGVLGSATAAPVAPWFLQGMLLICAGNVVTTVAAEGVLQVDDASADPPRQQERTATATRAIVPLPPARLARGDGLAARCRGGVSGAGCRRIARLASSHVDVAGEVASYQAAIAAAGRSYVAARARGDGAGQATQAAVLKVYAGALAEAQGRRAATGRALAAALARAGVDPTLSAGAAETVVRRLRARGLPSVSARWLASAGIGRAQAAPAFRTALGRAEDAVPADGLDLRRALGARVPTAALLDAYSSITPSDLVALVAALEAQGALDAADADALGAELAGLGAAPAAERAAARQRLGRLAERVGGRYGVLLRLAVDAL